MLAAFDPHFLQGDPVCALGACAGSSQLSQAVAKALLVEFGPFAPWEQQLRESWWEARLLASLSRKDILRLHLHTVDLGYHAKGVVQGIETYWRFHHGADVSHERAATLAVIATQPSEDASRQDLTKVDEIARDKILGTMLRQGWMKGNEHHTVVLSSHSRVADALAGAIIVPNLKIVVKDGIDPQEVTTALAKAHGACLLKSIDLQTSVPLSAEQWTRLGNSCLQGVERLKANIGREQLLAIANTPMAENLQHIQGLWIPKEQQWGDALGVFAKSSPKLRTLRIDGLPEPAALDALARMGSRSLEELTVAYSNDAGAVALSRASFPRLATLSFRGETTARGLRAIMSAPWIANLRELVWSDRGLTAQVVRELGTTHPNVLAKFLCHDFLPCGRARGAWSSARAAALTKDGIAPVDVVLSTDQDVALLKGVVQIQGTLVIEEGVQRLGGLQQLRRVDGSVLISAFSKARNLKGLSGLEFVGGNLELFGRYQRHRGPVAFESTRGLKSLRFVGGSLHMRSSDKISLPIPGLVIDLPALECVGHALHLSEPPLVRPFSRLKFAPRAQKLPEGLFPVLDSDLKECPTAKLPSSSEKRRNKLLFRSERPSWTQTITPAGGWRDQEPR